MSVLMSMRMSVVTVVSAAFELRVQPAVQVRPNQIFDDLSRPTGQYANAILAEQGKRALADAADDQCSDAQPVKPPRERPWLVLGCRQRFGAHDCFGVWVHFNDRKLAAAAEMRVKATVLNWNSYLHMFVMYLYRGLGPICFPLAHAHAVGLPPAFGSRPLRHRPRRRADSQRRPQHPGIVNSGWPSVPARKAAITDSSSPQICGTTRMPARFNATCSPCEIAPQITMLMPNSRKLRTMPSAWFSKSRASLRSNSASPLRRTTTSRAATSKTGDTRP